MEARQGSNLHPSAFNSMLCLLSYAPLFFNYMVKVVSIYTLPRMGHAPVFPFAPLARIRG